MRQHVGCEECDGDGIPVFQIESHGFRQVGTHLFERVAVADFQQDASHIMRPPGMRPTTPPCDARTIFGAPFVTCPNRGPSGRVRVPSLTNMNRGSRSCTSISGLVPAKTRALLSASAICAKWLLSVNSPMEKLALGLWQLRPSRVGVCLVCPSKPLMMCRLMSGLSLMALRVSSSTCRLACRGFAEGVGVGGVVGVFVVVDELSYPLHGVVEHGPSLVWMVC